MYATKSAYSVPMDWSMSPSCTQYAVGGRELSNVLQRSSRWAQAWRVERCADFALQREACAKHVEHPFELVARKKNSNPQDFLSDCQDPATL